jgi:hypothetical protein
LPLFGAVLPIRQEDMTSLEGLVSSNGLLIPGNFQFGTTYDVLDYLEGKHRYGYKFRAMFDRNLITRIVGLVRGDEMPADPASARIVRYSAACMAFCILAEIEIEPAMALYEGASAHGNALTLAEYRLFRIADHVNSVHYTEIALGRLDALPSGHIANLEQDSEIAGRASPETNFNKPLRSWKPNYLYLLKTAELRRSGLSSLAAATALLRWQADETFYNAPASVFCLAALGHKPPSGRMIKGVGSEDPNELARGLRNATWDVSIVSQWARWLREPDAPSWIFSTTDNALKVIARTVLVDSRLPVAHQLLAFMEEHWGSRDAKTLVATYDAAIRSARIGSAHRNVATAKAAAEIDESIRKLELRLGIPTAI